MAQQFVNADAGLAGQNLQRFDAGVYFSVEPITDSGLANADPRREVLLRQAGFLEISREAFHGAIIGATDTSAIAAGYLPTVQTPNVEDQRKTILQRATEALTARLQRRATQTDIADAAGIKQPSVAAWANSAPRLNVALAFCKATGICVEWFYTGKGPKWIPPTDPESQDLWNAWTQLDEPSKARVIAYAYGLADAIKALPPLTRGQLLP